MSQALTDAAIDAATDAVDGDSVIRCMWANSRRGQDIRAALGGVNIGVIGHRVKALELPVRDHNLQILTHGIEGEVNPLLDKDEEE